MPIPEAEEVTIKLDRIHWELLDPYYRYEWDDPEWLARKDGETEVGFEERLLPATEWKKRKNLVIESVARRIKYEALLKRVVGTGHKGKINSKIIYDTEPARGVDNDYQVLSTRPASRDVRITEATRLLVNE